MKVGHGLALFCACFSLQLSAQAPAQTTSIEGRVLNAVTGDPVRKAALNLYRNGTKTTEPIIAAPDANGSFVFRDLEPGDYRLEAEGPNYLRLHYGAKSDDWPAVLLRVKAGQPLTGLVLKLAPNSVISGRVTDDNGDPLPNLLVAAYRSAFRDGKRSWTQVSGVQTNDRGEYRLTRLRAGRYRVAASDLQIGIGLAAPPTGPLPEKPEPGNVFTFFGNSADPTHASAVDIGMGEDRRGTDIRIVRAPTLRIRGKVTGAPEDKILMAIAMRKNSIEAGSTGAGVGLVQQKDGRFEIRGLTPGSYLVMVRAATEVSAASAAAKVVELTDQHLDNVEIAMSPGGELRGNFQVSGGKISDLRNPVVRLVMTDYALPDAPEGKPAENGAFTIKTTLAGRYRAAVSGLSEDAYVKSIKLAGREVDPDGFELEDGAAGPLEIAVSRAAARISGTVVGDDDAPLGGAIVTLIPVGGRNSLARVATSESDGAYHLDGIAPGKYRLFAWTDLEGGAHLDPEFMKPFESKAQSLNLEENARPKLTVHVLPRDKSRDN